MSNNLKSNVLSVLAVGSCLGLLGGCGGGGNGSGVGTPTPTPAPNTSFDATYQARVTPSDPIPGDGQAPTTTLTVLNGIATTQFTFFLQPSVVTQVQAAIDAGLTSAGFASAISANQAPANIPFSTTGRVDDNGRVVFTSTRDVSVCGPATLTLDTTLPSASGATSQGNYNISFRNNLTIRVSGRDVAVEGTCNNLPLRSGTVEFTR